ncbi:IclR family transcriptional regulator [Ammoniphilus resinae]
MGTYRKIYNSIDIRRVALPYMQELAGKYGETSYLTTIDYSKYEGIVLEKIESNKTLIVVRPVGSNFPLYASATGKSLLSGLTDEELDNYFEHVQLIPFTERTLASREKLKEEIELIRHRGYATTHEEMGDGASAISSPIRNYQDKVVAAISLAGPSQRMMDQIPYIVPEVKSIAEMISKVL